MKYLLLTCLLLCTACSHPVRWESVPPTATLGVPHFIYPQYDWQLMAGVLPQDTSTVSGQTLGALDTRLAAVLKKNSPRQTLRSAMVRQCEEITLADKERQRFETSEFWKSVGKCMSADFLLIPYISRWQEREGGEWGVTRPAAVTLDLYLIEVATGQTRRFHFEEEQHGLAENILSGKIFMHRKGRWITALDLATEGLEAGIKELGL